MRLCLALTFALMGLVTKIVMGQVIQSNGTGGGSWNLASTWSGGVVPNASNSTQIRILNGDAVNVPSGFSVSVDQMQIRTGGLLRVDLGGQLTVVNASGSDLTLFTGTPNGQLIIDGTIELSQDATIVNFDGVTNSVTDASTVTVNSTGIYRHNYTTTYGTILGAMWQPGSTVAVVGYTTNSSRPLNLNQNFSNFVWNCPSQTGIIDLKGDLTSVGRDLSILSTGGATSGRLRFFYAASNNTVTVGGNLTISGSSGVWFSGTGTNNTLSVTGDILISANVDQIFARTGTLNVTCHNLSVTGTGVLWLGLITPAMSTISLTGNLNNVGGLAASSTPSNIIFSGSTPQTLSGNGSVGNVNWTILDDAIVDVGTNSIRGSGALNMNAGSELRVGSTNSAGAIQNNTTNGNILISPSLRVFDSQATIVYNGAATQSMSVGHPIVNTVINNNQGVNLVGNGLVFNSLVCLAGVFDGGNKTITVNGNWTINGGTFARGTSHVIFNGISSILGAGPFSFSTLTINSTASIVMPSAVVTVGRNLNINSGANFSHGNGTMAFDQNANQTVRPNGVTFNNISVNKTGGDVILNSSLNLSGTLSMSSPTFFRTYGFLALLSTSDGPTQDARIAALPPGAMVIGDVTVQRYMSAEGTINRYISSPINGATVADLQGELDVTGDFTGTSFPCTGCTYNGPSMRYYREQVLGNASTLNNYKFFPVSSNTEALERGRGYVVYMWNGAAQVTWDLRGSVNQGAIALPVTHTVSSPPNVSGDGFNLVGNPYPSAIVWNGGAGWTMSPGASDFGTTVSVPDNSGGSTVFRSYNYFDNSGNLTNGIIAMGQAFWVYAATPGATLTINEQAKSSIGGGTFYRQRAETTSRQLGISLEHQNAKDYAFLKLNADATPLFDWKYDALKFKNDLLNISLVDDEGRELTMHTVSELPNDVALVIETSSSGKYTIGFEDGDGFDTQGWVLVDRYLDKSLPVSAGQIYTFTVDQTNMSFKGRFYLAKGNIEKSAGISVYPNPIFERFYIISSNSAIAASIHDLAGKEIWRANVTSGDAIDASGLASGIYILRVKTETGFLTKRIIKQ